MSDFSDFEARVKEHWKKKKMKKADFERARRGGVTIDEYREHMAQILIDTAALLGGETALNDALEKWSRGIPVEIYEQ